MPVGQVANGGVLSLYDGLEPLLFREVPFIMTKFLVFDLTQSTLFHLFPAARETFGTSLLVSFAAGTLFCPLLLCTPPALHTLS